MGFFADGDVRTDTKVKGKPTKKLLHDLQCGVCPLASAKCLHPKMPQTGAERPDILALGEGPGENEDKEGAQFVGSSGQYLRARVPREWIKHIRWDNVVRCRPPDNRTPEEVEVECCRPRHTADVEKHRPKAIFGFGQVPLTWANGASGIAKWRGRRSPVRVGDHTCWMYFFNHPSFLIRQNHANQGRTTEEERMFGHDLKRAFAEVAAGLPVPEVHTREDALAGIECVWGERGQEDVDRVADFLVRAAKEPDVGVDYETNAKRPYLPTAKILTISVSAGFGIMAFALDHRQARWTFEQRAQIIDLWLWFMTESKARKAVHNLAFEHEWNAVMFGREYLRASRWDCTQSQAFVLDQRASEERRTGGADDEGTLECYSLSFLSLLHFGLDIKTLFRLNMKDLDSEPVDRVLLYNGVDSKYHRHLLHKQDALLVGLGLAHVYERHLPRVPACVLTQVKGVPLDFDVARILQDKYEKRIVEVEEKIARLPIVAEFAKRTGYKFNPASDDDVMYVMRDILKRPEVERKVRKNGKTVVVHTTSEAALSEIDHPVSALVLEHRGVSKQESTYCFPPGHKDVWPDECLHPMFNTCRARTSRLSSAEPNGQNWPKRDAEQKEMRKQFVAEHRERLQSESSRLVMLSADQGQIEARVFAMASKDKVFTKMLWEDYDVHLEWAERISKAYPRYLDQFSDEKSPIKAARQDVKSKWVFAQFFGATIDKSSSTLKVPVEVLQPLHREFWKVFSGLHDWHDRMDQFYKEHGYVELLTGRRRCGPLGFNAVINTPIQGTAAEIVNDSLVRVSEWEVWDLQPILQVHDDLPFILPLDKTFEENYDRIVRELVRPTFDFINVPLVCEVAVGQNMYEMEEIAKVSSATIYGRDAHLGLFN